jgi:hypothetical protein
MDARMDMFSRLCFRHIIVLRRVLAMAASSRSSQTRWRRTVSSNGTNTDVGMELSTSTSPRKWTDVCTRDRAIRGAHGSMANMLDSSCVADFQCHNQFDWTEGEGCSFVLTAVGLNSLIYSCVSSDCRVNAFTFDLRHNSLLSIFPLIQYVDGPSFRIKGHRILT